MLKWGLISTIVIFLITILVISIANRKASLKDAITLTDSYSQQYANEVELYLEEYLDVSRALASIFEGKESYPAHTRRQIFMSIIRDVLLDNPHFLAVWTIWEPNAVDGMAYIAIKTPTADLTGTASRFDRDSAGVVENFICRVLAYDRDTNLFAAYVPGTIC